MRVFITRIIPKEAANLLRKEGFTVDVFKSNRPITKVELIQQAKNAAGIISLLTDEIDKEVIDSLKKCKVIANYAVGYNNIDVEYAKSKGIIVTNTPDILTHATADLAVALVLACARHIKAGEKMMRENEFTGWEPQLLLGVELRGKTVGIIGAGRIGQETALRLKSFGTKIIYFNRSKKAEFEKLTGVKKVSLNTLLKSSDIISLHVPLTDETYYLLNRTNLNLLKPNCIIVNTARGEIIEEKELIKLLKKNKIFSAGFDVYENEPDVNKELLKLENVVLLPHLGSATNQARSEMALLAAKNIISVVKGKKAITPV